jgi:hypothetical protein
MNMISYQKFLSTTLLLSWISLPACTQPKNQERNLANANQGNSLSYAVAFSTRKPDLVITSIATNPANPKAGEAFRYSAKITNIGNASTPAGVIVGVSFATDQTTYTWSDTYKSSIKPGASVTLTANSGQSGSASVMLALGGHTVQAYVNDIGRFAESNTNNNTKDLAFTVAAASTTPPPTPSPTSTTTTTLKVPTPVGLPDLVVTSVTTNPAQPIEGQPFKYVAKITNVGTGATPAGSIVGISFGTETAQFVWSDTYTNSIAPGASVDLTSNGGEAGLATISLMNGQHTVHAYVNDVARFPESDITNNTKDVSFLVAASGTTPPTPTSTTTTMPPTTPTPTTTTLPAPPSTPVAIPPRPAALNAAYVIGETSNPGHSTFIVGQSVGLSFWGSGLGAGDSSQTLNVTVLDEHDKAVSNQSLRIVADNSGNWQINTIGPNTGTGFYRVKARTSAGKELWKFGTRGAGYLTYAVVVDPAKRILVNEMQARFGMQGGLNDKIEEAFAFLGVRWVLDSGYRWGDQEPDFAGQYNGSPANHVFTSQGKPWKTYTLPSLYVNTPTWAALAGGYAPGQDMAPLNPQSDSAWANYATKAVKSYAANNPDRMEHIYQMTWEPEGPWRWTGTPAQLVHIYKVVYNAIHAADPKAKIIGPCLFAGSDQIPLIQNLLNAGLADSMDGFSNHPYATNPDMMGTLVADIRAQRRVLDSTGKSFQRFGTEQGWSTENNPANDMTQARNLLKEDIIMLGEGYRFNMTFYMADWNASDTGYGYYYNLNSQISFGTDKISPKPIVPAYAFYTSLLEGANTQGAIENLGGSSWGYKFVIPSGKHVIALFDYSTSASRTVDVPAAQAEVYDWMGRKTVVTVTNGKLTLNVSTEPVYVVY